MADPTETPQFEFPPHDDRLFSELASRMRFVGGFFALLGALGIALMLVAWAKGHPFVEPSSVVLLLVGGWTLAAARSFGKVAETRGRDISHLLHALTELRRMYGFFYAILIAGLIAMLVLFLFVTVAR